MQNITIYYGYINQIKDDFSNLSFLKDEDFSFLERFKTIETKKEKALSLYLKRKYIGEFYLNEHGKPLSNEMFFNVSHSYGLVMMAKANNDVGIDVELIRESEENLKKFISSEEEYLYIKDDTSFFEIWCAKEGLVKALGSGINTDLKKIPALPINGKKDYFCKEYYSKTQLFGKYILNVTFHSNEDFNLVFMEEKL